MLKQPRLTPQETKHHHLHSKGSSNGSQQRNGLLKYSADKRMVEERLRAFAYGNGEGGGEALKSGFDSAVRFTWKLPEVSESISQRRCVCGGGSGVGRSEVEMHEF